MPDRERLRKSLLKSVRRALKEFALIVPGDRVAVGVSGGKDSRALLELLLLHRSTAPFDYDLLALHVDGTAAGLPDARATLEPWLSSLEVDSAIVPLELPGDEPLPLDCHRCSWNRRRALFRAAHARDYNRLALAHHADDAAVTALMSVLFNGRLETMAPALPFFGGSVTLIRPLIYAEGKKLAYFARVAGYPQMPDCPQAKTSERARVERMLRQFGPRQRMIRANLWRAARREMGF
jgi:tRNA 2-thiocytidine biosynthesis protein TtcA